MKTSAAGRAKITQREGNKLKAYRDTKGIWTIKPGFDPSGFGRSFSR